MPVNKIFSGGVEMLAKALDLRSERQGMIQSNIANMETPGYKTQELPCAEVMEKAMTATGELSKTNKAHLDASQAQTGGGNGS